MPVIRRLVGPALAVALVGTSTVFTSAAAQTSDGASGGTAQPPPALSIVPDSGRPGSQVTAAGSGYGDCSSTPTRPEPDIPPPTDSTSRDPTSPEPESAEPESPADPGDVSPTGPDVLGLRDQTDPAAVGLTWDGEDLAIAPLDDGAFSATFAIPETASAGTIHTVEARCAGESATGASAEFTVIAAPAPAPLVFVPDLIGLTVGEAEVALDEVGLELGGISGVGDVIGSQRPALGTEVARGTAVDVTVGAAVPELVVVPNLVWVEVDDARRILESAGLVLGRASGDGDVIRDQTPGAGARVPSGSPVDVTLASTPVPERQVLVPNLVGGTVDEARAALAAVRLVLGGDPGADRTVESQAPAAGTLVPVGTTVTVTVDTPATAIARPTPLWPVAAVLILVGVAGLVGLRALRPRRGPKWVRTHVRIVVDPTPPSHTVVTPPADRSAPSAVRIEPYGGTDTLVLKEVER
jgi:beta-lactam-binding protein with PASTA domain